MAHISAGPGDEVLPSRNNQYTEVSSGSQQTHEGLPPEKQQQQQQLVFQDDGNGQSNYGNENGFRSSSASFGNEIEVNPSNTDRMCLKGICYISLKAA